MHLKYEYDAQKANEAATVLIRGAGWRHERASTYPSLADRFASLLDIPCIRLDHRPPAHNAYGTPDALASFDDLDM
ncbi:hypothetical protein DAEQUDRAFT_664759 [Daedalea quercina L-15889]|uniref:Uncharacterized protein n=1 Tax=Daedalea quercina L-15889 TaxID=1314783 RepID=A0A165SKP0_9APHY|nr:hypothetical protein DAEQUDRAFT_664759 [Daedalea quercina L-15889]